MSEDEVIDLTLDGDEEEGAEEKTAAAAGTGAEEEKKSAGDSSHNPIRVSGKKRRLEAEDPEESKEADGDAPEIIQITAPVRKKPRTSGGSSLAAKRLQKEFDRAMSQQQQLKNPQYTFELVDDDLFHWRVKLYFDHSTKFGKDLKKFAQKTSLDPAMILLFQFSGDHPFSPPVVRALRPRVKTGTGYVFGEGAICVDMLAPTGWSPANRIEAVLESLRSLFLTKSYEARVNFDDLTDYTLEGWRRSFKNLKDAHPSWKM